MGNKAEPHPYDLWKAAARKLLAPRDGGHSQPDELRSKR